MYKVIWPWNDMLSSFNPIQARGVFTPPPPPKDNFQRHSEVYDLAISCWISSVVHRELWIISGIAHLSTLSSINLNRRVEQGYLFLCGGKKDSIHKGGSTNITDHFQGKRGQYYAKYRNKKEVLGILELTFSDKEVSAIDVSGQIGLS